MQLSRDSAGRETDLAFDYAEFARHSPDTVQQVLAVLQRAGMQTTVSSTFKVPLYRTRVCHWSFSTTTTTTMSNKDDDRKQLTTSG